MVQFGRGQRWWPAVAWNHYAGDKGCGREWVVGGCVGICFYEEIT